MAYLSVKKIYLFVFLILSSFCNYVWAVPETVTMQTRIIKPNGAALEASAVNFRYTTLDSLGACVLYVEQFSTVDMTGSGGISVHNLGSGTQVFSATGSTFTSVFNNTGATYTCQAGGSYVPGAADRRRIVIQFNDGSGSGWQTLQGIDVNSVPFSSFAGDSTKLAGHAVTDFTLKAGFPDCNTAGKVLTFNGTSFTCVSPSAGSGTVTDVTSANNYLTVASGTTTPVLTANVGTAANTLAAGNDTRIVGAAQKANNLSDLSSITTARTNLGLGTAAVLDVGVAANNVVQLDSGGKILTAVLPAGLITATTAFVGDVTGNVGATVVSYVGAKTAAQVVQSVNDTTAATNLNTASTIVKRDASGNIAVTNLSATNVSTQNNYLYDTANTNKILLKAPTTGITDYSFILPPVVGTADQIIGYNAAASALENKSITAGAGVTVTHSVGGIQISATGSGGTVSSVTSANADIGITATTTAPVLTLNSGTGNNQIVKLDASAKLPAVDGSALTNLTPANLSAVVPITKGGTNAITAVAALNNLLPTQTSNANKFLQTDGTNATWVAGNAGTVTNVTSANSYLSVATPSTTPALTVNVGTAANTLAAGNDARIVGAVQQTDYSGDVASVLDSNCAAGSTAKWNAALDMWLCTAIGSLDAAAITTGTINSARLPTSASFWNDAGSGKINYNGGNVGIGTATPNDTLSVNGGLKLGRYPATATTVSGAHTSGAGTINVVSTAGYPPSGTISLFVSGDLEQVTYTGMTATSFTGCTRGVLGTTALSLTGGEVVSAVVMSAQQSVTTSPSLISLSNGKTGVNGAAPFFDLSVPIFGIIGAASATTGANNTGYVQFLSSGSGQGSSLILGHYANMSAASGSYSSTAFTGSYNPTSGTANAAGVEIRPTFNGVSSGTASALVVAPVMTAWTGGTKKIASFGTTTSTAWSGFTEAMGILSNGNVNIGALTPTAALHLKAGAAAAGKAPLKLTAGVNLTTAESGAIEFDGTNLYYTDSTPARRTIATTAATTYTGVSSIANSGGNISLSPNSTTGSVLITSTTASTGASNGSLVVSGGVGVGGDIYATSSINAGTTITALTSILTPQLYGSASASGNIKIDGTSHATKGNVLLATTGPSFVGIGTLNPYAALHVATSSAAGLTTAGVFSNPNSNVGAATGLMFKVDADATSLNRNKAGIIFQRTGSSGVGDLYFVQNSASDATNATTADSKMMISSAGNVGIGTSAPTGIFQVAGGTAAASTDGTNITLTAQAAGSGTAQNGGNIVLMPGAGTGTGYTGGVYIGSAVANAYKFKVTSQNQSTLAGFEYVANDTLGSQMILAKYRGGSNALVNSDNLGILDFSGRDNTGSLFAGARIFSSVDGTPAAGQTPANLVFQTSQNGTGTLTERMRINSSGKVGIGSGAITTTGIFQVAGTNANGGELFNLSTTTTSGTASQSGMNNYMSYVPTTAPTAAVQQTLYTGTVTSGSANVNAFTSLAGANLGAYYYNATGTIGSLSGATFSATNQAAGTVNLARGNLNNISNLSTGTISAAVGVDSLVSNYSTGTISTAIGLRALGASNSGGGTITSAYGLMVAKQNGTGIGSSFGIYQQDSGDKNYFAGRVGVGTSPAYSLDVSTNVNLTANSYFQMARFADGTSGKGLDFGFQANAAATGIQAAYITSSAGNLTLGTNGIGPAIILQDLTGSVGVNTASPGAKLDVTDTSTTTSAIIVPRAAAFTGTAVNGMVRYNTASTLFEFRQNGAWVNYTTVSDGRLKTNVVPVQKGLDYVNRLNPVFYDWDRTNPKAKDFADKHQLGFIAQEVEKVLPEVVNQGEDSYRSLEYGKMVAVVVAAVKELYQNFIQVDNRVLKLEQSNRKLEEINQKKEREIASLKTRLDKIEKVLSSGK